MNLVEDIINSARVGWLSGGRVYITFMVVDDNGNQVPDCNYPIGTEFIIEPISKDAKFCTINISPNACKKFTYNEDTKMFEYDVCVHGRPFLGTINPDSALAVFDPDTNKGYGNWIPKRIIQVDEEDVVEYKPPVLVSYNEHIIPKKSTANLVLVH